MREKSQGRSEPVKARGFAGDSFLGVQPRVFSYECERMGLQGKPL